MNSRSLPIVPLLVLVACSLAPPVLADWPVSRHDPARTAHAAGSSSITKPTRYWQAYVGGALSGSTHVALDIDGDGIIDLVYLAGGKVVVKHADDRVIWESTPLDLGRIEGVADLDGDGALELVASSGRNVFVFAGSSGSVLWKSPDGEVGNIGAVRVADLDGDGDPELLIDDCACCGVTATVSPPGGVYDFVAGSMGAPTKLYAPLSRSHCGSQAVTVGDFDGDGADDVAYHDGGSVIFTSGDTCATLGASATLGETLYYASCIAADVDGRPGDELICFQNSYYAAGGTGGRRVFAVTYDPTATPVVTTLYNIAPVPKDTGSLLSLGDSLADLDGDGQLELTVAWSDGNAWSTSIYDAATGASLGSLAEKLEGIVDVDGDKLPEVVTTTTAGLVARRFVRAASPALTDVAAFPSGYHVRTQHDFAQAARGSVAGEPLEIDLEGDGEVVPIFFVDATSSSPAAYVASKVEAGAPVTLATYEVPEGISILTNQVYANLNRPYPQLVLARNDGFLTFLDSGFSPTNGGTFGSPEFPVVLPGMRVGGFIGAPIAPRLGGTSDAVVVTDSRGALVNLDASSAWMAVPPKAAWEVAHASSPSSSPTIDNGEPGIVCAQGGAITALRADGSSIWTRTMPGGASPVFDTLPGDVNGDGVSDVFAGYLATGALLGLQVWDGKDGTPVWPAPLSVALSWGFEPFSVADHNGDGIPDMVVVPNNLRVLHGATGASIVEDSSFLAYFTPTILDVDGDGVSEVTLSRGYYPARTYTHDLSTVLWTGADDRPYQHGARAACGGQSVWVQPSKQVQGMLRLVVMNGASVGATQTLYLAGGEAFASVADANAAGRFLGMLGDVAVKQDLLGTGEHPSALIGSSDGFLYALNPCAGTIDWAFDMKFAVGDPIFADPTGSGVDQILVPAADGYIHALQQQVLPSPGFVNDNAANGASAVVGVDLDEVQTVSTLAASWSPVAGADGYQVAALTEGGTFVTQPDWVSIGNVTSTTVLNLSLAPGKRYFFAVRAASKTMGSSPETVSNGAVVEAPPPSDGGAQDGGWWEEDAGVDAGAPLPDGGQTSATPPESDGCGCRVAGEGQPPAALGVLGLALLSMGARRRR